MLSCQSLYCSRTCTKWAFLPHMLSANTQTRLSMHEVCQSLHCSRIYTKWVYIYGIFYQSMLKQTLACVQSHQSLHSSRTCAKWAYIWHILLGNAQTSLSVCEVLPEPTLLSHIHRIGMFMASFISQC